MLPRRMRGRDLWPHVLLSHLIGPSGEATGSGVAPAPLPQRGYLLWYFSRLSTLLWNWGQWFLMLECSSTGSGWRDNGEVGRPRAQPFHSADHDRLPFRVISVKIILFGRTAEVCLWWGRVTCIDPVSRKSGEFWDCCLLCELQTEKPMCFHEE